MKRVVVTGMGMVSPLGNSLPTSWEALFNGKSGLEKYQNDRIFQNKVPYTLALVKDFDEKKWKVAVPH